MYEQMSDAEGHSIMWHQAIQYGQQRHKDMLVEAERQRILAHLPRQHNIFVRRGLASAGRILIAIGRALTPASALQPETGQHVWSDS
jgi:hypothetical protein